MSKFELKYTDDNGIEFRIEAEGVTFKASRTDKNNGRLINIPDMTDEEAWEHTDIEGVILSAGVRIGNYIGAFDASGAGEYLDKQEKDDEDFV